MNIFKQLHTGGAGLRVGIVRGAGMADIDNVRDLGIKPHRKNVSRLAELLGQ